MSTFNGLDLVLLMACVALGYALAHTRRVARLDVESAYVAGYTDGVVKTASGCYPNLQRASQTAEPYDWAKDGL